MQKALSRRVFRIFTISPHPMDNTKSLFAIAFAKFSKRVRSSRLGSCYQPLLAPPSKIAKL